MRDELINRFGALPQELEALLDLTRLRLRCREVGVVAVHAGPAVVALTPGHDRMEALLRLKGSRRSEHRVILPLVDASPAARLHRLLAALQRFASVRPAA